MWLAAKVVACGCKGGHSLIDSTRYSVDFVASLSCGSAGSIEASRKQEGGEAFFRGSKDRSWCSTSSLRREFAELRRLLTTCAAVHSTPCCQWHACQLRHAGPQGALGGVAAVVGQLAAHLGAHTGDGDCHALIDSQACIEKRRGNRADGMHSAPASSHWCASSPLAQAANAWYALCGGTHKAAGAATATSQLAAQPPWGCSLPHPCAAGTFASGSVGRPRTALQR